MITGERGIKKKGSLTVTGSRRYNIPLNLWLVAITRKHKHTSNTTKIDATISKNHKKKQARRYNIQKSQEKTSTTKTRATHNQHNEDRRYNIPLNLLLVATGCMVHCGCVGVSWQKGGACTAATRVSVSGDLQNPLYGLSNSWLLWKCYT